MLEALESFEALENTLARRDHLRSVHEPLAVVRAIADAIGSIRSLEEGMTRLRIQPSDTLQAIHEHVRQLYEEIVIPRCYRSWWKEATRDLAEEVRRYTASLEKLRTLPCATRSHRRNVFNEDFGARITGASRDYDAACDDPAVFGRWKHQMEAHLLRIIADYQALQRRIEESRPTGFGVQESAADDA